MNKTTQVRVFYTNGCPNASQVIDLIERIADDIDIPVVVDRASVTSQEEAVKLRCLGSPTIQINGLDIDPSFRNSVAFVLG